MAVKKGVPTDIVGAPFLDDGPVSALDAVDVALGELQRDAPSTRIGQLEERLAGRERLAYPQLRLLRQLP